MILEEKVKRLEEENQQLKIKNQSLEGALKSIKESHEKLVRDKSVPPWLRLDNVVN